MSKQNNSIEIQRTEIKNKYNTGTEFVVDIVLH